MSRRTRTVPTPKRPRKVTTPESTTVAACDATKGRAAVAAIPDTSPLGWAARWLGMLGAMTRLSIDSAEEAAVALGAVVAWGTPPMVKMAKSLASIARQRCDAATVYRASLRRAS